ncbi:MAG: glucosaminidase domain-containing protein [Proteobacteria bacterium]|nr:glucosaminidase domain-containing protein [Pseudomonadota bacterium]
MIIISKKARFLSLGIILLAIAVAGILLYQSRIRIVDFSQYPAGPERKQAFFDYFSPIIKEENEKILQHRARLEQIMIDPSRSSGEINWALNTASEYGIKDFDVESKTSWPILLHRVDAIPPSLTLVQAANESAWGTSRFAKEGYNFFGQWCFEPGCGLVPRSREPGKQHEVAQFDSPRQSVQRYIFNLNTHNAYKNLRNIRSALREDGEVVTGSKLAEGLIRYSARGQDYISELKEMIQINNLEQMDMNATDPAPL